MKQRSPEPPLVVWTIGHSTRTLEEFERMLQGHQLERLVDVRTVPRSRHNPQFNKTRLPAALRSARIKYLHMPGLGGLRHARPDSRNTGWRNLSFRGYADYMQTPEFVESLDRLIELAKNERVAIMCAEAVPWRCHRSLIADALLVRGIQAEEIVSGVRTRTHKLTPWARVRRKKITYPAAVGDTVADKKKLKKKPAASTRSARRPAKAGTGIRKRK